MSIKVNFPLSVKNIFRSFAKIAKEIGEHPIVIGGFIRDFIYNNNSDGDIDVVLRYGKNFTFSRKLVEMGASEPDVYENTGTLHTVYNGNQIEIQSSNNPLVHFDIDDELIRMGIETNWINRNVYERDFTFNTIVYDPIDEKIIDATGLGVDDLTKNKILRCPISSRIALINNPIIITRAVKFALQFGLRIDDEFLREAPNFIQPFVNRINSRHNRHYMKSYIHQTFDLDFEQTYNYYEQIGFLDVIPVGEELGKQIQERKMGIMYRKPLGKIHPISSYFTTLHIGNQLFTVFKNPAPDELERIKSWVKDGELRALISGDGNLYAFNAYSDFHQDVAIKLGIEKFIGIQLFENGKLEIKTSRWGNEPLFLKQAKEIVKNNEYLKRNFGTIINIQGEKEMNEDIQMQLNEDENKVYSNFNLRNFSKNHKLAILDLLSKNVINENTKFYFLDIPEKKLTTGSVLDDDLRKKAIQIEQHLYDSIKGKQEYKKRKRKEHKNKTIDMFNTMNEIKKMVGEKNGKNKLPEKERKK